MCKFVSLSPKPFLMSLLCPYSNSSVILYLDILIKVDRKTRVSQLSYYIIWVMVCFNRMKYSQREQKQACFSPAYLISFLSFVDQDIVISNTAY
jgi:hypothetical protein